VEIEIFSFISPKAKGTGNVWTLDPACF